MKDSKDILVQVEGVSKKFSKDLKRGLWYGVKDLIGNVFGKSHTSDLRPKEFWAVRNVSFEVRRGECLALIGHNGAGKSTLLKMLNGLITPDEGCITMRGRVGALIELGAGFNPILTGRENVYNNGAVLGFSKKEIDDKLEHIIAFSELEKFIDMPVQHYSSGMKVRLGFAIAAQMEPDILLIDEVLAVGDLGFVLKCFKRIDQLLPQTAIVFVSHNMPIVSRICTNALLLEKGSIEHPLGGIGETIDRYYNRFSNNELTIIFDDGSMKFGGLRILNAQSIGSVPAINWGDDLNLEMRFSLMKPTDVVFNVTIHDKEQRPVCVLQQEKAEKVLSSKEHCVIISHCDIQLSKGLYSVSIAALKRTSNEPLLRINNVLTFQVIYEVQVWQPFMLRAAYKWSQEALITHSNNKDHD